MEKTKFDFSSHMKALNAARTKESFAKSKQKRSEAMKRAWARKGAEARKEVNRKISASQKERLSKIPPRAARDMEKKRIKGIHDFYKQDTIVVQEHKEYLGYLSKRDLAECIPSRRELIIAKRKEGQKASWDRLDPEEREERLNKTVRKCHSVNSKAHCLYETNVPRIKNYCGVVTEHELEAMHG